MAQVGAREEEVDAGSRYKVLEDQSSNSSEENREVSPRESGKESEVSEALPFQLVSAKGELIWFLSAVEGILQSTVLCETVEVVFSQKELYVNGVPCNYEPLTTSLNQGDIVKFDAVRLSKRHQSGAQYIATLVWKDDDPKQKSCLCGRVFEILNPNEAILICKMNGIETKVLCNKREVVGKGTEKRSRIKDMLKVGKIVHFTVRHLEMLHPSGAEYQCTSAWLPGIDFRALRLQDQSITYNKLINGGIYEGVVTELQEEGFVVDIKVTAGIEKIYVKFDKFSSDINGKMLTSASKLANCVMPTAAVQVKINKSKGDPNYNWVAAHAWLIPKDKDPHNEQKVVTEWNRNVEEGLSFAQRVNCVFEGHILFLSVDYGNLKTQDGFPVRFSRNKARLFGLPLDNFNLMNIFFKGKLIYCCVFLLLVLR